MGDEIDISAYLSTRFPLPWSSVRDVICIHCYISLLHYSVDYYGVPKNRKLATIEFSSREGSHQISFRGKYSSHALDQTKEGKNEKPLYIYHHHHGISSLHYATNPGTKFFGDGHSSGGITKSCFG